MRLSPLDQDESSGDDTEPCTSFTPELDAEISDGQFISTHPRPRESPFFQTYKLGGYTGGF